MLNDELTKREIEVLKLSLVPDEKTGERLYIAPCTIKTHRNNIYQKLLVHNKAEMLIVALKLGIINIEDIEVYNGI